MALQISDTALQHTYQGIRNDFGDLGDLPRELATTVANVYYRFFAFSQNAGASLGGGSEGHNPMERYSKFMQDTGTVMSSFQFAKELINSARETRKHNSALFDYMTVLTLDVLKYNIDNAADKTPIRRAIERKFKKVDEISDLLDIMSAKGMVVYTAPRNRQP